MLKYNSDYILHRIEKNRKDYNSVSSNGPNAGLWHSKAKKRQFGRRVFTSGRDNPHYGEKHAIRAT